MALDVLLVGLFILAMLIILVLGTYDDEEYLFYMASGRLSNQTIEKHKKDK